jgi:hypothetical protein
MTGAILKVQYKKPNDKSVDLCICGNFFFIDRQTIVTCQHVLDKENMKPPSPFRHYQLFLLFQNQQYELTDEQLYEFPYIDPVIVRLRKKFDVEVARLNGIERMHESGTKLECASYENDDSARIPFEWNDDRIAIRQS